MDYEHYCTHCGSKDLEAGELRASGREWNCRQCDNSFQRDDRRDDDAADRNAGDGHGA